MAGVREAAFSQFHPASRFRLGLVLLISAGVMLVWWLYTPNGLLGKADAVGYAVCHRIELRSFHLGARSMPLCARCTGMYLAAIVAFLYFSICRPRAGLYPDKRTFVALGVMGLIWAADGFNSYLSLFPGEMNVYPPSNLLRILTGAFMGIALSAVVYPTFHQVAWEDWKAVRALRSPWELLALIAMALVAEAMVLSGNPLLLYPLALISAVGVLLVLSLVYSTMLLAAFRLENRLRRRSEIVLPLLGGLTLAILQIGVIDLVRYWLTGTWNGFQL
jgi:uncharacterized membrane protein